jgi:DNA-binding NarL/FixJ family response regulator
MRNRAGGSHNKVRSATPRGYARCVSIEDAASLTTREHQVLRDLAHGLSNREIGHSLEISIETVKEHVQNM